MKTADGELKRGIWFPAEKPKKSNKKTMKNGKKEEKKIDYHKYMEYQKKIWNIEDDMAKKYRAIRELQGERMSLGRQRIILLNQMRKLANREALKYGEEI